MASAAARRAGSWPPWHTNPTSLADSRSEAHHKPQATWLTDDLTDFLHPGGQARQVIDQLGDARCILGQLLRKHDTLLRQEEQ
jgi:hypothetical protein